MRSHLSSSPTTFPSLLRILQLCKLSLSSTLHLRLTFNRDPLGRILSSSPHLPFRHTLLSLAHFNSTSLDTLRLDDDMLLPTFLLSSISLISLTAPLVNGFFKLPCDNPLIQERADPIISPGKVAGKVLSLSKKARDADDGFRFAGHTHTVNGGSNFGLDATYESLRRSECSSCRAKADLSGQEFYPSLFCFQD